MTGVVEKAAQQLLHPWASYAIVRKDKLPHGLRAVPHVTSHRCHCGIGQVVASDHHALD